MNNSTAAAETAPVEAPRDPLTLPGPRGMWETLKTILKYFNDSRGLHDYAATYGETVYGDSVFGPVLYTSDPALVKKLWTTSNHAFISFSDVYKCLLGDNSVVLMEGEGHILRRKLMMPMFHGETLKAYGACMNNAAKQRTTRWEAGRSYLMQVEMGDVALKIIIGTVLGAIEPKRVEQYSHAIAELGDSIWAPGLYLKKLRLKPFGLGPWARFERNVKSFQAMIWEDMKHRRENGIRTNDAMSELLFAKYDDGSELSYQAVCDELSGLLMAGYDTVSVTLTWALYDLYMNPEVLTKLRDELATLPPEPTLEQIGALPYLEGVVMETLRVHPPSFETTRRLAKPMVLDGYAYPENTGIVVGIIAIHNRPDIYPEPEKYRPERFLERKFAPHEFLTFGGGTRRCMGSALTLFGMKLTLAEVLRNWDLELLEPGPVRTVRGDPGLKAVNGIPMKVLGRRELVATVGSVATEAPRSGCPISH